MSYEGNEVVDMTTLTNKICCQDYHYSHKMVLMSYESNVLVHILYRQQYVNM
jgi:hypothetical protein